MSEELAPLTSSSTPEQQAAAREMGWQGPDRYKGDPEKFVDADEFVRRADEVLPILRADRRRLQEELAAVRAETAKTNAALEAATEAIENMQLEHSVATAKAVEDAKKLVREQLAAASEAGDHAGVAELTEQMVKLNAAKDEPPPKKIEAPKAEAPSVPPELASWLAEEAPWWGKDKRKTALFLGIATEMQENMALKKIPEARGIAFYDAVKAEFVQSFPESTPRSSKVEGGSGGGDPPANGAGYSSLPADAKAQCDRDAKRFVGENKRYKDISSWRKAYAERYNNYQ